MFSTNLVLIVSVVLLMQMLNKFVYGCISNDYYKKNMIVPCVIIYFKKKEDHRELYLNT